MATKAEVARAQEAALLKLDQEQADFIDRLDELREKLREVSALFESPATGMHEEGIKALSAACSLEYDLLGDTAASSGFAQALGVEDELSDFEESSLAEAALG